MARTKKEKEEINNEQILEAQAPAPETTETPVVDEGQPIMPDIEDGKFVGTDPDGGVEGEMGDNADDVMDNPQEETQTPEDTEGNTENPEGEGEETEKAPEGENEVNTQNPEGEDKGDELIEQAQTVLEGNEKIEDALKNNEQDAATELLKQELERVNEIKAKLEADIEKREAEIKKRNIKKKRFQNTFGGFWNGVTSGWEE